MNNNNLKILLIEDNPGDARMTQELLMEKDFRISNFFHALDIENAEKIIKTEKIDCILLDLNLPGSSGQNTVKRIFEIVRDTPVIIISGTDDEISELKTIKLGVQDYFVKGEITSNVLARGINSTIIRSAAERELKHLNEFKDNLLSIMSHDLRSPFNALIGYLDLTIQDIEILSEDEIVENLQEIKGISFTVLHFIENLLAWSRLQSGSIKVKKQKIKLSELLQQSEKVINLSAKSKNICLEFSGFNETEIYADQDMLDAVFRNLICNAIKYSSEGSKILVKASNNDFTKISIFDTGIGIAKDDLENIFNINKKRVNTGTRQEKGHGLGLLICKDFIERNGGELSIESELGKGTKVLIKVPKVEI